MASLNNNNNSFSLLKKNNTLPKTKKNTRIASKHDALIKFLLMLQVLTATVIQNIPEIPEIPEIGSTKQKFTNSNKPVYPKINLNNTMNIATGLYGKSINSDSNTNNEPSLKNISSMLDKQMELAQKLDITKSDIDKASNTLKSLIKKSLKNNNKQFKSHTLSTRSYFRTQSDYLEEI